MIDSYHTGFVVVSFAEILLALSYVVLKTPVEVP